MAKQAKLSLVQNIVNAFGTFTRGDNYQGQIPSGVWNSVTDYFQVNFYRSPGGMLYIYYNGLGSSAQTAGLMWACVDYTKI